MRYHSIKPVVAIVGVATGLLGAPSVWASITVTSPDLPVAGSFYISPQNQPVTFSSPSLATYGISSITLADLIHTPTPGTTQILNQGPSGYEETFDSTLTGIATITLSSGPVITGSLYGKDPTEVVVNGYTYGAIGGPWTTSLTLNWPVQVIAGMMTNYFELACSNAPGSTSVTAAGGGYYDITSYFDVTPEISLDGGADWIVADNSVEMSIAVPEQLGFAYGLGSLGIMVSVAIKALHGRKQ